MSIASQKRMLYLRVSLFREVIKCESAKVNMYKVRKWCESVYKMRKMKMRK